MSEKPIRITEVKTNPIVLKIVVIAIFTALGVVLSYFNPFAYFSIYGAKPNPFIHLINCVSGVLLGPFYSILISVLLAILRNVTQTGSILAFPGGISGAIVVGIIAAIFKRKNPTKVKYAALFEPLGTVFIGGTISSFIITIYSVYIYWVIFAVSSIIGVILGFIILTALEKRNVTFKNFEKFESD